MPVSPYKGNIYPIMFGQAGMVAHENRWLASPAELATAANLTFENDALQKDAAVQFYDPIGIDNQNLVANGTVISNWQVATAAYGGAKFAAPFVIVQGAGASQASPWTIPSYGPLAAGSTVFVSFSYPATAAPTITDSKGNVYTPVLSVDPSDPTVTSFLYTGAIKTPTTGADSLTVTFTGGATSVLLIASVITTPSPMPAPQQIAAVAGTGVNTLTMPPTADPWRYFRLPPMTYVASVFVNKDAATDTISFTNPSASYTFSSVTQNLTTVGQLFQYWKFAGSSPAIVGQIDWNSEVNTGNITGTVAVATGSTTVTGTGTSFQTVFSRNDVIIVNGEEQSIASIASNTSLTTYNPWQQAAGNGLTASRRAGPRIVTACLDTVAGHGGSAVWKEGYVGGIGGPGLLTGTLLQVGSLAGRRARFVVAGKESAAASRKLFLFSGYSQVRYLADDGVLLGVLSAPPVDWSTTELDAQKSPVNGLLHNGALFGWGNLSDPHRIYRSTSADHTKFVNAGPTDDAGQYPIASSIGERLWCGAEFQGVLWLWKYPRGIFYFDDIDPNYLNWSYHIRSEALGCAPSPYATVPIDDDVIFMAPDGHVHSLMAVSNLGGTRSSDITRQLGLHRWTRETIDVPSLGQMTSTYNSYSKIAYFGVRSKMATTQDNDLLLKFDFGLIQRGGPVRFSYSNSFRPNSLCIRRTSTSGNPKDGTAALLIGENSTAMLELLDDGIAGTKNTHGFRNDAQRGGLIVSQSYSIYGQSPRLDFADQDPMNRQRRKNYDCVEFIFGEAALSDLSAQTLTAFIFVDSKLKQTITLQNLTATRVLRMLRCGDGFDWQIALTTNSVTSTAAVTPTIVPDIYLLGLEVYWRPGSQDHQPPMG